MDGDELQFLDVGRGSARRRIAVRISKPGLAGRATVLWLIGLKSDMVSTKAEALAVWCRDKGLGFTRFDYSGHGQSSGDFAEATVSDWLEEAEVVFKRMTGSSSVVVVGSSTGAHIGLILLRRLMNHDRRTAARIRALVLIAPAWDVTELIWQGLSTEAQQEVLDTGVHAQPSEYGEPYLISRRFIKDGRKNLLADQPFDPERPVFVLQGLQDKSVPVAHARALKTVLHGDWIDMTEVEDAEHRLSRPQDLDKIYALIEKSVGGKNGE